MARTMKPRNLPPIDESRKTSVVVNPESEVVREKRRIFAEQLAQGKSKAEAARYAGYHPSNVDALMRHEDVVEYLREARSELQDISTLKRVDILNIMMEAVNMARTLSDPAQMINGAKELGKLLGLYEPETIKVSMSTDSSNIAAKFAAMSDDELYAIAAGQAKVIDGEVIREVEH